MSRAASVCGAYPQGSRQPEHAHGQNATLRVGTGIPEGGINLSGRVSKDGKTQQKGYFVARVWASQLPCFRERRSGLFPSGTKEDYGVAGDDASLIY